LGTSGMDWRFATIRVILSLILVDIHDVGELKARIAQPRAGYEQDMSRT
jgi:hypothetical protein